MADNTNDSAKKDRSATSPKPQFRSPPPFSEASLAGNPAKAPVTSNDKVRGATNVVSQAPFWSYEGPPPVQSQVAPVSTAAPPLPSQNTQGEGAEQNNSQNKAQGSADKNDEVKKRSPASRALSALQGAYQAVPRSNGEIGGIFDHLAAWGVFAVMIAAWAAQRVMQRAKGTKTKVPTAAQKRQGLQENSRQRRKASLKGIAKGVAVVLTVPFWAPLVVMMWGISGLQSVIKRARNGLANRRANKPIRQEMEKSRIAQQMTMPLRVVQDRRPTFLRALDRALKIAKTSQERPSMQQARHIVKELREEARVSRIARRQERRRQSAPARKAVKSVSNPVGQFRRTQSQTDGRSNALSLQARRSTGAVLATSSSVSPKSPCRSR